MVGKSKSKSIDINTTKNGDVTTKEGDVTVTPVDVKKMKSIVLTSTGSGSDYSNLQIKDEDYPKIDKENQVIVKIKAVGLNFAELMQRQGIYKPSTKTPYTPGFEGSGIVEEISENVTDLAKGDRVIVFNTNGIWKESVMVPRTNVIKMPENMTFEDGAGLLTNYLTAYQIIFRLANIKKGDSVLIHMAAGGVGAAAIQLVKTIPDVIIFGTASVSKHETIKEWGVDHPIDYTTSDYVEQIKKISPEGVDVVLDPLNGENAIKGFDLLKPFGRIVHYGSASMTGESRSLANMFKAWWKCLSLTSLEIISENKSVSGYHLGVLLNNPSFLKTAQTDIDVLLKMYEEEKIKIQVDSVYGYSKIGEAMKRMHQRLNVGKIILKPDSEMPAPPVEEPAVEAVTASVEQIKLNTEEKSEPTEEKKSDEVKEETVEKNENKTEEVKEETDVAVETKPSTVEPNIIEKTNKSEITKPETMESECATRE